MMLGNLGVQDGEWIEVVAQHHQDVPEVMNIQDITPTERMAHILRVVDRYAAMISPRMSRAGRSATDSARSIMASTQGRTDPVSHALVRAVGLCPPGTYVRMDSDELAVVLRRSSKPNHPYVAIVGKATGELLTAPRLHGTAQGYPRIRSALPASSVRVPLNHYIILRLSAHAAKG